MMLRVAAFEFGYQVRGIGFWITTALFAVFAALMMGIEDLQVNMGGNVFRNSPMAIVMMTISFAIFYLFAATAFVANAVVRDDETGFAPIVRATPLTRLSYLLGRFLGAYAAAALSFLAVPVAFAIFSQGWWLDPKTVGPFHAEHFAYAYAVFGLSILFVGSSILFALASVTRSMLGSYVGLIVLMAAYFTSQALPPLDYEKLTALADPFGLRALVANSKYWTSTEVNTQMPPMEGLFLWNRLLWVGLAAGILAASIALFRFERQGLWLRRRRAAERADEAARAQAPLARPSVRQQGGLSASLRQFAVRVGFEFRQVVTSPAFIIILLVGILLGTLVLWTSDELYGTRTFPVTRLMVDQLMAAFSITPGIIALFYAGELVWRERGRKMNEIVGAAPAPDPVFVLSKTLALWLVLLGVVVTGMLTAMGVQAAKGYTDFEIGKYVAWWVIPQTIDFGLLAALAIFFQAIAPNKFAGWGFLILYTVVFGIVGALFTAHNMLQFAAYPTYSHSDMNGAGDFARIAAWYRGYWAACAVVLLAIACVAWPRGARNPMLQRLAAAPRRLAGPMGAVAAVALAVFIGLGAWIFINTTVWNTYVTPKQAERYSARLEKELLKFEDVPQPSVLDVKLDLDLDPHAPRLETVGAYTLENRTGAPLTDVHLRFPRRLTVERITLEGLSSHKRYKDHNYYILTLASPMQPGERRRMTFETALFQRGFRDEGNMSSIADNGTFLNHSDFSPSIGMTRDGLLGDPVTRRKHGLPEELRVAKLEDSTALDRNYIGADWVSADITITTVADQTPIAPGYKVSDTTTDGRRTARFVTEAPILHFFSVQSARYEERHLEHQGVDLAVYYDPRHAMNVDKMLNAMRTGLDYYQANFGPYQFRQARIIEFPYGSFAQAFANTMPYSEQVGFIADTTDETRLDYVTFITAHELGHQWWAHQIVGADTQGAAVLSETLAEYSALMVMEKLYGPDKIRRFLRYELDTYLSARASETYEELPLYRAEYQGHIYYQKGGMVMYLLRDQIGEAAVNRALRGLIERHAFKAAPYPRSTDLVAALRAEAPVEHQQLITDLFERITLYDTKVKSAKAERRADGKYNVTVTIAARKLYADGKGKETEAPLAETFDIGLFTREPGAGAFDSSNVVLLERRPIRTGEQTFTFVVDRAPTFVGVDPYVKRIDRNAEDNIFALPGARRETPRGSVSIKVES